MNATTDLHVIFGTGPLGKWTARELARQGKAILMISSDLPEVLAMSDRILVMHEGLITAEIERADASEERVMFAATGQADGGDGEPAGV
jgi:rhamnose transport system ATP-binding protein